MKTTIPHQFLLFEHSGNTPKKSHRSRQADNRQFNERARQLADITASGEDAAECAAADLAREFLPLP
jgi:hypothetical protein